jgi:hypothetical protein
METSENQNIRMIDLFSLEISRRKSNNHVCPNSERIWLWSGIRFKHPPYRALIVGYGLSAKRGSLGLMYAGGSLVFLILNRLSGLRRTLFDHVALSSAGTLLCR